jgi:biopolymer transport protein TolR
MASINVVPYIDVMLVLLIIFMVTAPLLNQGLNVDLPKVTGETIATNAEEPVIIIITKSGAVHLNISDKPDSTVTMPILLASVKKYIGAKPQARVLIKADKNTTHGNVLKVMGELKSSGITQLGLITLPEK